MEVTPEQKTEQHYQEVLKFVRSKGHASCLELMKNFHISYTQAVHLMDTLEERDIVDTPSSSHPRPLLTDEGRVLKMERQKREREENKSEAEKPIEVRVQTPTSVTTSTVQPVPSVRKRTKIRTKV